MSTFYEKFLNTLDVKKEDGNIVAISYIAFILSGMITVSMGLIVPYLYAEYSLTFEETSRFLTAHQVGNIIAIIGVGYLPYYIGKRKIATYLCSLITIGFLMIVFFGNPILILVGFTFAGIGKGAMGNFSNASIAEFSGKKSMALNLLHATASTGAFLGPLLFFFSESINMNFRFATLFLAVFAWFIVVLFKNSKLSDEPIEKTGKSSLDFFKSHWFWIDSLILCFYIAVECSIINWSVIYFTETGVLTPVVAGFTPIIMWSMMVIGRILCARISNDVRPNVLVLILAIATLVSFGLLLVATSTIMIFILLGIAGFSMSGIYPTTYSTLRGAENNLLTGFSLAIASLGGVFMPAIVGIVADEYGIRMGMTSVLGAGFILLALVIIKIILTKKESMKI